MQGVHETFADYRIEGVLGQGGMGTVYLAHHPRLPRLVALKLLNRQVSEDEELRRRFEQEANVVARLEHPGIVGVYDRGSHDGHLWISMQYVRGTDASRLVPATTPGAQILRFIADTAAALDYAHGRGVLHRDIKPANILIAAPEAGREAHAVLTDFGIARLLDADTKLTATGTFTATLAYAAPEQLSGEPVDHRTDQYSLACTLFTLLTGQPPFPATNPGQVVAGHLTKPVPRLTDIRPDLPPHLDAVVARAMAKHRDERFGSCGEFAAAAVAAFDDRSIEQTIATTTVVHHPSTPIRHVAQPWPSTPVPPSHPAPPRSSFEAAPRPTPAAPASSATATTAAIAAFVFGLFIAVPALRIALELWHDHKVRSYPPRIDLVLYSLLPASVAGVMSLLLVGGSLALLSGLRLGRVALVLGCLSAFLSPLIAVRGHGVRIWPASEALYFSAVGFFALFTVVFALLPQTGSWLRARRRARHR